LGRRPQGRRGAGSPARVRGRRGQPERSTGSASTLGSFLYRRGIFAPSTCRVHAVTWHNVALAKWQLVRRAWCEPCRSTERVEKYTDGTRPWSVCFLSLSNPPCSQDYPKLTHTRVPRTALTACSGAMDATSVSSGASAREQAERVPLDAYASALPSGIAREAHGRKMRPRAEGTPEPPPTAPMPTIVASCGPTAMPRPASVCSSATGGACVCERSRLWRRSTRAVR
jgi:hypothetical protein